MHSRALRAAAGLAVSARGDVDAAAVMLSCEPIFGTSDVKA